MKRRICIIVILFISHTLVAQSSILNDFWTIDSRHKEVAIKLGKNTPKDGSYELPVTNKLKLDSGYYEVGFTYNGLWGIRDFTRGSEISGKVIGACNKKGERGWTNIKTQHSAYGRIYWTGKRWRWETNEFYQDHLDEWVSVCCIGDKL